MAIRPEDALRSSNAKIDNVVKSEETRIDSILAKEFYGPPLCILAPDVDRHVSYVLMELYKAAGWIVECRNNGQRDEGKPLWVFRKEGRRIVILATLSRLCYSA